MLVPRLISKHQVAQGQTIRVFHRHNPNFDGEGKKLREVEIERYRIEVLDECSGMEGPKHDEIAALAYALYLEREGDAGTALEDWLLAESILRSRQTEVAEVTKDENPLR